MPEWATIILCLLLMAGSLVFMWFMCARNARVRLETRQQVDEMGRAVEKLKAELLKSAPARWLERVLLWLTRKIGPRS